MSETQTTALMLFAGWISYMVTLIAIAAHQISRNTRPPKPDIKSFINRNTKGDK